MAKENSHPPRQFKGVTISSTFTDLEKHRAELIRVIKTNGLTDVAMENDSAKPVSVIDSSMQMVRDGSAYIGLISHKYGQTPGSADLNPENVSITELEFNEALRLNRPILLFVMSENHPVLKSDIEPDPNKQKKLDAFRERATKMEGTGGPERVYATFESLEDFKNKAAVAVAGLIRSLEERSEKTHRVPLVSERGASERESILKERSVGRIITNALADTPVEESKFLGFADYADALFAFISSERTEKPLTVGIDAAWGMGKTSLMRMLRNRLIAATSEQRESKPRNRSAFPTVWFNAWKYDQEEVLWAALVLEILRQINSQLTWRQRLRLSFTLNWARLDKRASWKIAVRLMVLGCFAVVTGLVLALLKPALPFILQFSFFRGVTIVTVVAFMASIIPICWQFYSKHIRASDLKLSKYLREPNYKERIGFLGTFQEDFKCVVRTVTEHGKWPLVVFVDDLDRCSPPKPVEIIEAINVLLDAKDCVFIIGMDTETVAASIEAKYKDLKAIIADDPCGLTLGERFLEKITQINLRIPQAYPEQMEAFIGSQLDTFRVNQSDTQETGTVSAAEQLILAEQRGGKDLNAAIESVKANKSNTGLTDEALTSAGEKIAAKAFEENQAIDRAVLTAAEYLDFNPRKVKRFINGFRLKALIAQKRGMLDQSGLDVSVLAKAVLISDRWPGFARSIVNTSDLIGQLREVHRARKILSTSETPDSQTSENRAAVQMKLDLLLAQREVAKYAAATEILRLLDNLDDSELQQLWQCFQLIPNKPKSDGD